MRELNIIDFSHIYSIHFVGIKGIAMAAFAVWAKERGIAVTGSDVSEVFPSDPVLVKAGIVVQSGFDPAHIVSSDKPDLVVFTGAHDGRDNIEVRTAIAKGIPVLPHGKALGLAMSEKRQISVAGSHGKTTTTAMIATVLMYAGLDPSYAVGCGEIPGLGLPGHFGSGDFFVAEADEYVTDPTHDRTPRFLWQHPEILVVTNIDYDHPDVYASLSLVQEAFVSLKKQQVGLSHAVINADDVLSEPLLSRTKKRNEVTYGMSAESEYGITDLMFFPEKTTFKLQHGKDVLCEFVLKVPGKHNVYDATAAAIASSMAGVPWDKIAIGLSLFGGAKRRFENIGVVRGVTFYDDYAHHPKEIQATLEAARVWYPKRRIISVFQPHTYSRTKKLLHDFGQSFINADIAVSTDIYSSAREHDTLGITGLTLVEEVKKNHDHAVYMRGSSEVTSFLRSTCKEGDIVLFMGAGDIYTWEKTIIKELH